MEEKYIVHGSEDSTDYDVVYIFEILPGYTEMVKFCSQKEENRNILVLKNGVVSDSFKGTPDELNNSLLTTFSLHKQPFFKENPIKQKVERIVALKVVRSLRSILTRVSRSKWRPEIKKALKSLNLESYISILMKIDFNQMTELLDIEDCKSLAYQLGQTLALVEGHEIFTKSEVSLYFKNLKLFIYRSKDSLEHLDILNDYLKKLLCFLDSNLSIIQIPNTPLNIFLPKNEKIEVKNFQGTVINLTNGKERVVHFPPYKKYENEIPLIFNYNNDIYQLFFNQASTYVHVYEKSEIQKTLDFWTTERMKNAKPFGLLSVNETGHWDGKLAQEIDMDSNPNTKYVPEDKLNQTPYKESGKVFFFFRGRTYVCSASSLQNNVVITAGHCMVYYGSWHKNWIFVPRYRDGEAPLGKWAALKGFVHDRWRGRNDAARDVAFAVVEKKDGKSISQVAGSLGFFIYTAGVNAIGYPVKNWGGEKMVHSLATIQYFDNQKKPPTRGISSALTPGCSGGPWYGQSRRGKGVFGVNSYTKRKGDIYSPSFDHEISRIWRQAIKE
eukprot:gene6992-11158_t